MYKYLQSDNNFKYYTMDGLKPKEDHIPLPSQTDLADKEQAPETEAEGAAPEATPAIA